ncbi:MAG: hypothetical protein J7480_05775, partial [Microbacteriaceae bacterium]|nr:hypothetical protein [Microbacteriaceae bacterium]
MATTMLSAAREALEVAEALGASEPREVPATTPLELDDPASAWIVSRGRVVVFAQPPGGALHERRTPVVEVMTGGLVLAPPTDAAVRLIAVGIEPGTELRGLPASALTGHRGHRAAVLAGLVDDWLGAISAALEAEAPEAGVALSSGEPALIGPGEAAWAATHPVWVQAAEVGVFDARPEGDRLRVPVPARGWVRGYAELELVPHRSAEALQHADAIAGIDAFHRAALEMLRRRIDAADELVAERIRRRVGYEADLRHRTLGRLADVLGSDAARSTSSATTDELVAVMRLVGHEQGIEIVEPPRRVLATASDPLDAIARASGVRTRAIVTGPQWWRTCL